MHTLKLVCMMIIQLIKQICLFPLAIASVVRQGRQQRFQNGLEAERLDRIRNPWKYRGK